MSWCVCRRPGTAMCFCRTCQRCGCPRSACPPSSCLAGVLLGHSHYPITHEMASAIFSPHLCGKSQELFYKRYSMCLHHRWHNLTPEPWESVLWFSHWGLPSTFKCLHRQEYSNMQIHFLKAKIFTNLIIRDNSYQIINILVNIFLDLFLYI